jgi:hypothetical protein
MRQKYCAFQKRSTASHRSLFLSPLKCFDAIMGKSQAAERQTLDQNNTVYHKSHTVCKEYISHLVRNLRY